MCDNYYNNKQWTTYKSQMDIQYGVVCYGTMEIIRKSFKKIICLSKWTAHPQNLCTTVSYLFLFVLHYFEKCVMVNNLKCNIVLYL